jgi:spore coat protein A
MINKRTGGDTSGRGVGIVMLGLLIMISLFVLPVAGQAILDPADIPKYENEITGPPPVWIATPDNGVDTYEITVSEFQQQILPANTANCTSNPCLTTVWGYGGIAKYANGTPIGPLHNAPAATFEATRGTPVQVKWINDLTGSHLFAVDPTLHWASPDPDCMLMDTPPPFAPYPPGYIGQSPWNCNAQADVPIITHLHGAEVQSTSDGYPEAWYTASGTHGMEYSGGPTDANYATFTYPNEQPATTLWYHDHALGITRINVLSGLAGFYLLRDDSSFEGVLNTAGLVKSKYEVPLAFQDRTFLNNGDFFFYTEGNSPDDHPYWVPEFFGNTLMVNGLVWPKMYVDQGVYRFRMLDGSNARFYEFRFCENEAVEADDCIAADVNIVQIGSDGGFLKNAVPIPADSNLANIPGERLDILVDFSALSAGDEVYLRNFGNAPFPDGDPVDEYTSTVMKFIVTANAGPSMPDFSAYNGGCLNPTLCGTFPSLPAPDNTRILVLKEVMNESIDEPVMVTLNGQRWMADISENPDLGATEEWVIVNPTADAHPIHLHLVQFQLVSRKPMDTDLYNMDWIHKQWTNCTDYGLDDCGTLPPGTMPPWPNDYAVKTLDPFSGSYSVGSDLPFPQNEMGWKDTIKMYPGQVTTIRARFAPIDGSSPRYNFSAAEGPGYVWHCHILDHEDNEMMRPYLVHAGTLEVCKTDFSGEPLSDWNITINYKDELIISQFTEGNGCTLFENLPAGTYTVVEEPEPRWVNVTPLSQTVDVNTSESTQVTFVNEREWCGMGIGYWKTNIDKYLCNASGRQVCDQYFEGVDTAEVCAINLESLCDCTGSDCPNWNCIWEKVGDFQQNNATSKAVAQMVALQLTNESYEQGYDLWVDSSRYPDECQELLYQACNDQQTCSAGTVWNAIVSAYEIGNKRSLTSAQKTAECMNKYTFGCSGGTPALSYCDPSNTPTFDGTTCDNAYCHMFKQKPQKTATERQSLARIAQKEQGESSDYIIIKLVKPLLEQT